jgi:serine/threonine protein phosphatase PrpC
VAAELHAARSQQAAGGLALGMAAQWRGEGSQHQGKRPYQEDSWALVTLGDGSLLAIVADGMGGHAGGAVASKLAVDAFVHAVEQGGGLADGLQDANEAVRVGAAGRPDLDGMGATVVAALIHGDEVRWISVGDSPFYLVTAGKLEQLNADHSMAPQIDALVARGMLTAEEAEHHPGRHTLREAVMGEPLTLIDKGSRRIGPGDKLLLCSDGVQTLSAEQIMAQASRPASSLVEAVLAAAKDHQDNITVVKLERGA